MGEYTAGADGKTEIRFNLMAMVKERKVVYGEEIATLTAQLSSASGDAAGAIQTQIATLQGRIAEEDAKRARWALENKRRKHNWLPLCVELMKVLARQGKLEGAIEAAKQKKAQAGAAGSKDKD